jgi:capsule polysaccharide export protein KpsC/LpsZ
MADWLAATVRWFGRYPQAQLVVRVHPGELLGAGHPSAEIVRQELPELPPHVTVVGPESPVNTYDLMELAHLGLVYTTTVGMEMAMAGIPVITAGATHYRGRGFTDDPATLPAYLAVLETRLSEPAGRRLAPEAIDLAWRYAYRFFFEYPFRFPWHLVGFWDDLAARPFESVLSLETWSEYAGTIRALAGDPIDWDRKAGVNA